jgi:choline kinase
MKAVILAAGLSTRLRQHARDLPKTLLAFGSRTILDFQLDSLFETGVCEVAIAVGYQKQRILDHVARHHARRCQAITFIENPRFAETNNIYSLWLALEWVGRTDFLALNADVLYHTDILPPALAAPEPISVIIDSEFRHDPIKVLIEGERVTAMRKGIPRHESCGTYIGITRFAAAICPAFFTAMKSLVDEGQVDVFFNVGVERLIAQGVPVGFTTTQGLPWTEIDDEEDLKFARTQVVPLLLAESEPAGEPTVRRLASG